MSLFQTQLQQSQKKTNNVTSTTAVTSTNIATVKISNGSNGNSVHSSVSDAKSGTIDQLEPKPVECNLCHRKFKNIPALNGHMRLHGGYFKKVIKSVIEEASFIYLGSILKLLQFKIY